MLIIVDQKYGILLLLQVFNFLNYFTLDCGHYSYSQTKPTCPCRASRRMKINFRIEAPCTLVQGIFQARKGFICCSSLANPRSKLRGMRSLFLFKGSRTAWRSERGGRKNLEPSNPGILGPFFILNHHNHRSPPATLSTLNYHT